MLRICNLTVAYGNKFTNYKNLTPFPKSKISTAERTLMLLRRIKNLTPFPKSKISTAERTLMLLRRIKNLTPFPKSKISTAERTLKRISDASHLQPDGCLREQVPVIYVIRWAKYEKNSNLCYRSKCFFN